MARAKPILACDCETDPFLYGRVPMPFIWGLYDGKVFSTFPDTESFVAAVYFRNCILYAHNGGKFDFMYLLPWIKQTKVQMINGRIVSMFLGNAELRDSFSIIPEPLKNFGVKKEIEYWKLEKESRQEYQQEILEYLFYDCKTLFDATTTYRGLAGGYKTIASNALAFARDLGIQPGKTNSRFDRKYRQFFFGGRAEVFRPGTHRNISILDIHSAYPFAMMHDHASGNNFERGFAKNETITDIPKNELDRSFIVLNCYSKGAFPKRVIGPDGGLMFPHEYGEFYVTGWEYNTAKAYDLISDIEIVSIRRPQKTVTFGPYVDHWFKLKQTNPKTKNKMLYTIAKIMMNSLYGKMAQDITRYYDYKIVPAGTKICFNPSPAGDDCEQCGERLSDHGWSLASEYQDSEIHRRESLWKYKFNFGKDWQGKKLYHNVATGASITGFTRAVLLRAIHTIGPEHVIYCDTDSLICDATADLSLLPLGNNLGDWGIEDINAPIGHFAGKKLYAIKMSDATAKKTGEEYKIASKGSKLAFDDLAAIVGGKTVTWKNPAPSYSLSTGKTPFAKKTIFGVDSSNLFVVRKIRSTNKQKG